MSNSATSGSQETPTDEAMRSPSARDMASPGKAFPRTNTRYGMSPSSFLTSPPRASIRFFSCGRVGLWSTVSSLALCLPLSHRQTIPRESPTCAIHILFCTASTTAIVPVVPDNATSNSSVLLHYEKSSS